MRILATSVFERIVYHCWCLDPSDPTHPTLEVDAILREGDASGPLLVAVADFKRMLGFDTVAAALPRLRAAGRTAQSEGVEYITFPLWHERREESGGPSTGDDVAAHSVDGASPRPQVVDGR